MRTAVFDPVSLMVGGAALGGEPMVQTAAAMAVAVWSTLAAQKLAANRHRWGADGVAEVGLADVIIATSTSTGQCLDSLIALSIGCLLAQETRVQNA